MPFQTEFWGFLLKILLAAVLGAVIGIERDLSARPAGMRTNMIIAIGACLFAILSGDGFSDEAGTQDPTRIASIVVQGIGFLGAGVMLKGDGKIMGLTTAATIWLAAAIGLAVGAGMEMLAIFVTVFSVIALVVLAPVSDRIETIGNARVKRKGGDIIKEE